MDMDGARGLPGLRSAWRSDLSPRANRIINDPLLNDIDIDNVRIEVFDVSAQLVDIPLTETADEPNVRAGSRSPGAVQSQDVEVLSSGTTPGVASAYLPTSEQQFHGHDRGPDGSRTKLLECDSDMHHEVLGIANEQLPLVRSANGAHLTEALRHIPSNGLGQSQPWSRGPFPRRSTSVDRSLVRREGSPARASSRPRSGLYSDSRTAHDTHLRSSGPAYRSKTPPRLHVPVVGGVEKPLSPTQSLPVIQNGLHHVHTSRVHGSNGEAHPRKEHVVEIPALGNHTIRTNGVREDNGRPHGSNGYVSENGQARHDRHPPPIKASSKKPPRCPTSHNGLNGDSGHHPQNGRRRRDSTELDRSKGKRGGGAAKWKMKLVMAILLVCFGTLVYFQVFYMRPQQLQAIMQGASQKEVLRAGLLNFGRREGPEDGVLRSRGEGNITDGLVGMRRRLLGGETEGGEQCSLIEGMRWFGRLLNDVRIRRAGNEGGGILVGGSEAGVVRLGRRLLAEGRETGKRRLVTEREGQRHERMEALDWGFGVGLEFLRRRPGSRDTG